MSKLNDKDLMNAGDISPSQLITTFGPGSVVNMRHDTVMIVGCHRWPKKEDKKRYIILHHELLQKKLKTNSFRMPLSHERSKNVPCFSFPRWGVCKNKDCQKLQLHKSIPKAEEGHSCWSCEKPPKNMACDQTLPIVSKEMWIWRASSLLRLALLV